MLKQQAESAHKIAKILYREIEDEKDESILTIATLLLSWAIIRRYGCGDHFEHGVAKATYALLVTPRVTPDVLLK